MSHYLSKAGLGLAVQTILAAYWDAARRCSFFSAHDSASPMEVVAAHVVWPLCYRPREPGKRLQQSVDEFQSPELLDLLFS